MIRNFQFPSLTYAIHSYALFFFSPIIKRNNLPGYNAVWHTRVPMPIFYSTRITVLRVTILDYAAGRGFGCHFIVDLIANFHREYKTITTIISEALFDVYLETSADIEEYLRV